MFTKHFARAIGFKGHYLYHGQVWSGELQEHANSAFASSPLRECTDETFARGYAMYCTGRLGGALAEFYKMCEANVSRLKSPLSYCFVRTNTI